MCVFYALYLWSVHGGRLLVVFQPSPHVIVCAPTGIWHGTNKSGKWRVEAIEPEAFSRWILYAKTVDTKTVNTG